MTRFIDDSSNFGADGPFFHIIREGLEGLADGEDYFDLLADDVVFEYVISVPGYPKRVEGRQNVIDLYGGYDSFLTVRSADKLRVHRDREASVVVLEYEVHGEAVQSGRPYDNRFVSIVTIGDGKVTRWRDYLVPVAVFDATGWPGDHEETASVVPRRSTSGALLKKASVGSDRDVGRGRPLQRHERARRARTMCPSKLTKRTVTHRGGSSVAAVNHRDVR